MRWFFKTTGNFTDLLIRLTLAVVIFPHGAQKVLGWFGGYGFHATLSFFTQKAGFPAAVALLVMAAEFLGSIGLIVGFFSRLAGFGIFCVMAGAIATVHWKVGFFMNWAGTMPAGSEGFEFHLLAMALAFSVMARGAGPLSIDRAIGGKR